MKRSSQALVDNSLEYLVDLKRGIIPLMGEVGEDMYAQVERCLMALSIQEPPVEKLTFVLNTYGGDLYQAFAIYDLIKMQPLKTEVLCNGPVMSAGTIIMQAADERIMTPRSYLMYHFGRQVAETQQCVAHFQEITNDVKKLYKKASKVSPKVINTWFEKETYYNAQEALKYGLIDRILTYEKEENSET